MEVRSNSLVIDLLVQYFTDHLNEFKDVFKNVLKAEIRWRTPSLAYKTPTWAGKTFNSFHSSFP